MTSRMTSGIVSLCLLMACGCSRSAGPDPVLLARVQNQIRAYYDVPTSVNMTVAFSKQQEFPNHYLIVATLSTINRQDREQFLLSKDGRTLTRFNPIEIDAVASRKTTLPAIDITGRPTRGSSGARVTVVMFDDMECPFCAKMHDALAQQILPEFGDRIKIVLKNYPLTQVHPWAKRAAIDAGCLARFNTSAYWSFQDFVHSHQHDIIGSPARALADQSRMIDEIAIQQAKRFDADIRGVRDCVVSQPESQLSSDIAEAGSLKIDGTPTLFVNGHRIDGAAPISEVRAVISQALAEMTSVTTSAPTTQGSSR